MRLAGRVDECGVEFPQPPAVALEPLARPVLAGRRGLEFGGDAAHRARDQVARQDARHNGFEDAMRSRGVEHRGGVSNGKEAVAGAGLQHPPGDVRPAYGAGWCQPPHRFGWIPPQFGEPQLGPRN